MAVPLVPFCSVKLVAQTLGLSDKGSDLAKHEPSAQCHAINVIRKDKSYFKRAFVHQQPWVVLRFAFVT